VSRYNFDYVLVMSLDAVIILTVVARSGFITRLQVSVNGSESLESETQLAYNGPVVG